MVQAGSVEFAVEFSESSITAAIADLRTRFNRVDDLAIDVRLNDETVIRGISDIRQQLSNADNVRLDVNLDDSITREITQLRQQLEAINRTQASVDFGRSAAQADAIAQSLTQLRAQSNIPVTVNTNAAQRNVQELRRGFATVQQAVDGLSRERINLEVNARNIQNQIAAVDARIQQLRDKEIQIRANSRAAEATIRNLDAQVTELQRNRSDIQLKIDARTEEINTIEQTIERLRNTRINLELNPSTSNQALNLLDQRIQQLSNERIKLETDSTLQNQILQIEDRIGRIQSRRLRLEADTRQAEPRIRQIQTQLGTLDDKRVRLNVDADNATEQIRTLDRRLEALGGGSARQALRQINRELRQLSSPTISPNLDLSGIRNSSGIVQGIFQGIGQRVFDTLANAIGGGIRAGLSTVQNAVGFEQALVTFSARAGGAEEAIAAVTEESRRLGIETSKTPEEVARIATRMVELGGEVTEVGDNVAGVVAALEGTGFTNIDATAKAIQAGTNIFNESADALADKITLLANTTAVTSAEGILQAFGKAGGSFVDADVSASTLLATFAKFSETATPEVAATATRNALDGLRGRTDTARDALDKLNVSFFDNQGPTAFTDTLVDLRDALEPLSEEDRFTALQDIFGGRSASQIGLLLQGLDDVIAKTDELEQGFGASGEAADNLNQGVAAAVNRLQGTLTTAGTDLGLALTPGIEAGVRTLTASINAAIEDGDAFGDTAASVEALLEAVDGSEVVDVLSASLRSLFDSVDAGAASLIDSLSNILSDPENLDRFGQSIENLGTVLGGTLRIAGVAAEAFTVLSAAYSDTIGDGPAEAIGQFSLILEGIIPVATQVRDSISGLVNPVTEFLDRFSLVGDLINQFGTLGPAIGVIGLAFAGVTNTVQLLREQLGFLTAEAVQPAVITDAGAEGVQALVNAGSRLSSDAGQNSREEQLAAAQALAGQLGDIEANGVESSERRKEQLREESLQALEDTQSAALARLAAEEAEQINDIRQAQLAAGPENPTAESNADSAIRDIQADFAQQRIQIAQDEIDQINQLRADGIITAEEAEQRLVTAKQESAELSVQAIEQQIAAEQAAADAVRERIEEELSARERLNALASEQTNLQFEVDNSGLENQLSISQALANVDAARIDSAAQLISAQLAQAEATENFAAVEEARDRLLLNQLQSIRAGTQAQQQQIAIQRQIVTLDGQRQITLAQIARDEAQIAVDRARSSQGISTEELNGLQSIVELRAQGIESARANLDVQLSILDAQEEEQSILAETAEAEAIRERRLEGIESLIERQTDLLDEQKDLESDIADETERRQSAIDSIVSSLSGLEDVGAEQALEDLNQLEDNLRSARRAGAIDSETASQLQSGINQAQRLARSGDGFTVEEAFNFSDSQNPFAQSILDSLGLGGVNAFAEAQQEILLADTQIEQLTTKLEEVRDAVAALPENIPTGIENLTVSTPDPIADAAQITADLTRQQQIAEGVI